MAPMASGVADRKEDWFVFRARFFECRSSPWIPIDRVVFVLEKVWRFFSGKMVGGKRRCHVRDSRAGVAWVLRLTRVSFMRETEFITLNKLPLLFLGAAAALVLSGCASVTNTSRSFTTVVIDAGHGGHDSGAHSRIGGLEKNAA